MSIIQGTAKGGGSTGFYDYPIGDSLRFDGSSYLSRTPTAQSQSNDFTYSVWVKPSKLDADMALIEAAGGGTDLYAGLMLMYRSSALRLGHWADTGTPSGVLSSINVIRDTSSFYHFQFKKTSTSIVMYVNGIEITQFQDNSPLVSGFNTYFNTNKVHYIGRRWTSASYMNGYMANIQFIDGQALDPYYFGEFKDNIWVPYNAFSTAGSGTATASDGDTATDSYGTNGFHLTFEDGIESLPVGGYTGNQNAFRDKSHNTNHWKTN
jgi:hypothetical protein